MLYFLKIAAFLYQNRNLLEQKVIQLHFHSMVWQHYYQKLMLHSNNFPNLNQNLHQPLFEYHFVDNYLKVDI